MPGSGTGGFLDGTDSLAGYRLQLDDAQKPNPALGIPRIRYATSPGGERTLVRSWTKDVLGDLVPFWQHEIRQLRRIEGLAAAEGLFLPILAAGLDDNGFHLVSLLGGYKLLASVNARSSHLTSPGPGVGRALRWRNVLRIAEALDLLHSQGLPHRNLGLASLLSAGSELPDLRLTGHEWSIRLTSELDAEEPGARGDNVGTADDVFVRDWRAFGDLVVGYVGVARDAQISDGTAASAAPLLAEWALLRHLSTATRIDARQVIKRIEAIAEALELEEAAGSARILLFMPLGRRNSLTAAIERASGIRFDDISAQRSFVERDLGTGAVALAVPDRSEDDGYELMLRGYQLSYRHIGSLRQSQWAAAYCGDAQLAGETGAPLQSQVRLDPVQVTVMGMGDPYLKSAPSPAGWLGLRQRLQPNDDLLDRSSDRSAQGLLLMLVIQGLVAMSEEFAVDVVEPPPRASGVKGFRHALYVRIRKDEDRERLASLLKIHDGPGERLRRAVAAKGDRPVDSWRLVEDPSDSGPDDEPDTEWEFLREYMSEAGITLVFGGVRAAPPLRRAVLVPSDTAGTHKQLHRQTQLWRELRDCRELLRAIANGRDTPGIQQVPLIEDIHFKDLDAAKKGALRLLARGRGLTLIQGPPGVGKTHLVAEFARQVAQAHRKWRVLFSAQSHSATDNLLVGVRKQFASEATAPLIVRTRARDPSRRATEFDLPRQVQRYAQQLQASDLLKELPPSLRTQVQELALAARNTRDSGTAARSRLKRSFESLLVRSADYLFSTSNASVIPQLIAERTQFDWSIVEEAAKATGNELIGPMLLSRQRIMIGDQRQLPPFNAELLERLLRSAGTVGKLLELAGVIGNRRLRSAEIRSFIRDVDRDEQPQVSLTELCEAARSHLYFFQSLLERHADSPVLTLQHRMHPAIARVVSHTFYGGRLESAESTEKFLRATTVVRSANPARYPEVPVVWVDMPWDQAARHRKSSESRPGPFNLPEVAAVARVLLNLIAVPQRGKDGMEAPTLAILSPYRAQVRALQSRLQADLTLRRHLEAFRRVGDAYVHTVDSFQGREADVVIVSLVRNNASYTPRGALGFLAEARRMNVLLSRAQWRLYIVGCGAFIRRLSSRPLGEEADSTTNFLQRMFAALKVEQNSGCAAVVPAERRSRRSRRPRRAR